LTKLGPELLLPKGYLFSEDLPKKHTLPQNVDQTGLQIGQTGFSRIAREELKPRDKLKLATNDLPIHPTDCGKTLGMPGSAHG
jgi:hypothetical protein